MFVYDVCELMCEYAIHDADVHSHITLKTATKNGSNELTGPWSVQRLEDGWTQ